MKAPLNHREYSASDFERYHSGQMPAAERHALEKAALDDPFLADALEGYIHSAAPARELEELRGRLFPRRVKRTGAVFFPWMRIAALVVIIAGASWVIFLGNRNDDSGRTGFDQKLIPATQETAPPGDIASGYEAPAGNSDSAASGMIQEPGDKKQNAASRNLKNQLAGNGFSGHNNRANEPEKPQDEEGEIQLTAPESIPVTVTARQGNRLDIAEVKPLKTSAAPVQVKNAPANDDITDTLIGRANSFYHPLPPAAGTDDTIRINIVLKEDKSAAEPDLVVIQKEGKSESAKRKEPEVTETQPADGWQNYNDYIAGQRLKMPEVDQSYTGEVELTFDVNSRGEPVNITVTKSVSEKCDAEAIRILREGPKWKSSKNKKGTLTIRF